MSLTAIATMFGPWVVKLLSGVLDRFWNHGISSVQGTAAGAAVIGLLQSFGCDLTLVQQGMLGSIAALPGFLATEPNRTATSLIEAAKQAALAAAQAKQPLTPNGTVSHS